MEEERRNTGRNDLCPCGSGRKFKHCHLEAVVTDAERPVRPPPGRSYETYLP